MMNKDKVKDYFEKSAKKFDDIYDNVGSLLDKLVNKVFRKSLKDFIADEPFDITLALGVFDYIKNPLPFLKKIKDVTRESMIVSFPAKFLIRNQIRKFWLATKNCPVYFYSQNRIISLYNHAEIKKYEIIKLPLNARLPNGYFVEAKF